MNHPRVLLTAVLTSVLASLPLVGVMAVVAFEPAASAVPAVPPSLKDHPARAIAWAYHFSYWSRVTRLDFTFNVQSGDKPAHTRQWSWWPKTGKVTLTKPDGSTVTYTRGDKLDDQQTKADRQFVNDSYWLLFPFQTMWAKPKVTLESPGDAASGEPAKVMVTYPSDEGYTPGDRYELEIDPHTRFIEKWTFIRKGHRSPMIWDKPQSLGPILVCTDHHSPEGGKTRLWFTGLKVQTDDGQTYTPDTPSTSQP